MNIFCKLEDQLNEISTIYQLDKITFKVNSKNNLGDISINIHNPELQNLVKNTVADLEFIADIQIQESYINIYIADLTWFTNIEHIFDDINAISHFNIAVSHIGNDRYSITPLIAKIYNENFLPLFTSQKLSSKKPSIEEKQLILSSKPQVKYPGTIYKYYRLSNYSQFDYDLFIWGFFAAKNNQNSYIDFLKLSELAYENKFFIVVYAYARACFFARSESYRNSKAFTLKERELLKLINYLPIVKKISLDSLDLYYINKYLIQLAKLFLDITYNLEYYNLEITTKIIAILEWAMSIFNIRLSQYL